MALAALFAGPTHAEILDLGAKGTVEYFLGIQDGLTHVVIHVRPNPGKCISGVLLFKGTPMQRPQYGQPTPRACTPTSFEYSSPLPEVAFSFI